MVWAKPPCSSAVTWNWSRPLKTQWEEDDKDGITDAIAALANAGIRAGVDKTPPTVVFASGSPTANDKDLTTDFIVHVAEEEDGSQLHSTPVTARLEVRNDDDKGMVCAPDNADGPAPGKTSMGECKSDVVRVGCRSSKPALGNGNALCPSNGSGLLHAYGAGEGHGR